MSSLSRLSIPEDDQVSSIKSIFEKATLCSLSDDKTDKDFDDPDPQDAYLGPKFWDKPITLDVLSDMDESEFSVMNINEFLIENDLTLATPNEKVDDSPKNKSMTSDETCSDKEKSGKKIKNKLGEGDSGSFLYVESKRARLEREAEERRLKKQEEELNLEVTFDPKELSLATVPGSDFDPRKCAFSTDELKPQPIIRKRKKDVIPTYKKDDSYWEKRKKNNVSARRSREARRLKENQIALRAAFLEKENLKLKVNSKELKEENQNLKDTISFLREKLKIYEK